MLEERIEEILKEKAIALGVDPESISRKIKWVNQSGEIGDLTLMSEASRYNIIIYPQMDFEIFGKKAGFFITFAALKNEKKILQTVSLPLIAGEMETTVFLNILAAYDYFCAAKKYIAVFGMESFSQFARDHLDSIEEKDFSGYYPDGSLEGDIYVTMDYRDYIIENLIEGKKRGEQRTINRLVNPLLFAFSAIESSDLAYEDKVKVIYSAGIVHYAFIDIRQSIQNGKISFEYGEIFSDASNIPIIIESIITQLNFSYDKAYGLAKTLCLDLVEAYKRAEYPVSDKTRTFLEKALS